MNASATHPPRFPQKPPRASTNHYPGVRTAELRMKPTIDDVARKAKVSISTVSRVLNRPNLVNEKTRKRVEQAIKQLAYRPNPHAQALMRSRSTIPGLGDRRHRD
jgi:predicted alpha/beta-hydrolase family hydrolase